MNFKHLFLVGFAIVLFSSCGMFHLSRSNEEKYAYATADSVAVVISHANADTMLKYMDDAPTIPDPNPKVTEVPPSMTGNDVDIHGCIGSAGYTYSLMKNRCIRLWEEATPLIPIHQNSSATINGYVIFNADSSQAELFIVEAPNEPVICHKTASPDHDKKWIGGNFTLHKTDKLFITHFSDIIYSQY